MHKSDLTVAIFINNCDEWIIQRKEHHYAWNVEVEDEDLGKKIKIRHKNKFSEMYFHFRHNEFIDKITQ